MDDVEKGQEVLQRAIEEAVRNYFESTDQTHSLQSDAKISDAAAAKPKDAAAVGISHAEFKHRPLFPKEDDDAGVICRPSFLYRVLSFNDAADAAGVSLSTLKRLIAAGALRKVRISEGRVGVFATELAGYLNARAVDISR